MVLFVGVVILVAVWMDYSGDLYNNYICDRLVATTAVATVDERSRFTAAEHF